MGIAGIPPNSWLVSGALIALGCRGPSQRRRWPPRHQMHPRWDDEARSQMLPHQVQLMLGAEKAHS